MDFNRNLGIVLGKDEIMEIIKRIYLKIQLSHSTIL